MRHLHKKTKDLFRNSPEARQEFKSQLRFLIIVALGFTIAFSWRETIFDAVYVLVTSFGEVQNPTYASITTSTAITLISLILLFITARLLQTRPEYR